MSSLPGMQDRLASLEKRYEELAARMTSQDLLAKKDELARVAKEHSELGPVVEVYRAWKKTIAELAESEQLANGPDRELAEMARDEVKRLKGAREDLEKQLAVLLTPKDPFEGKTVLLEIR